METILTISAQPLTILIALGITISAIILIIGILVRQRFSTKSAPRRRPHCNWFEMT